MKTARDHLTAVMAVLEVLELSTMDKLPKEWKQVIHDARNYLSSPERQGLDQTELCVLIRDRLNSQYLRQKEARNKVALELALGAGMVLHATKHPAYDPWSFVCVLVASRGAEVIDNIARGKPV